jgi:hypothetical protein
MKPLVLVLLFAGQGLFASAPLQFDVTDGRGRQTSAIMVEASGPDQDGWRTLTVLKAKGDAVLVWPFDGTAGVPDGPGGVPVVVINRGEEKALQNTLAMAALGTPVVLGLATPDDEASRTGLRAEEIKKAWAALASVTDPFEKGVALLYAGKSAEAADQLAIALRQRQRQLTRMPSEIYAAALLYGKALYGMKKFDDAAVAFLAALKQRPSDKLARDLRADALVNAGKPDAVR